MPARESSRFDSFLSSPLASIISLSHTRVDRRENSKRLAANLMFTHLLKASTSLESSLLLSAPQKKEGGTRVSKVSMKLESFEYYQTRGSWINRDLEDSLKLLGKLVETRNSRFIESFRSSRVYRVTITCWLFHDIVLSRLSLRTFRKRETSVRL